MPEPDDLTPEGEEQVRRLLADARHTAAMPDDVVARLDGALADLRRDDPAAPTPAPVLPVADLAAARRRRAVRGWLAAAAAVVVLGVGINQVVDLDGASEDSSSAGAADSGVDADRPQDEAAEQPSAADGRAETSEDPLRRSPLRLDPARFEVQVTRVQQSPDLTSASDAAAACRAPGSGRGRVVPVRYAGQAGVLVLHPVRRQSQVVDLFLCGTEEPERSVILPAP